MLETNDHHVTKHPKASESYMLCPICLVHGMYIQVHATQASAASHTAATNCMLFMMSRAVLTSSKTIYARKPHQHAGTCFATFVARHLCAVHSSKARAKESLAFAQKRQGMWVGTVCWLRCRTDRPSAKL